MARSCFARSNARVEVLPLLRAHPGDLLFLGSRNWHAMADPLRPLAGPDRRSVPGFRGTQLDSLPAVQLGVRPQLRGREEDHPRSAVLHGKALPQPAELVAQGNAALVLSGLRIRQARAADRDRGVRGPLSGALAAQAFAPIVAVMDGGLVLDSLGQRLEMGSILHLRPAGIPALGGLLFGSGLRLDEAIPVAQGCDGVGGGVAHR